MRGRLGPDLQFPRAAAPYSWAWWQEVRLPNLLRWSRVSVSGEAWGSPEEGPSHALGPASSL